MEGLNYVCRTVQRNNIISRMQQSLLIFLYDKIVADLFLNSHGIGIFHLRNVRLKSHLAVENRFLMRNKKCTQFFSDSILIQSLEKGTLVIM